MATTTPVLGLLKPIVGADDDLWGGMINESMDILDAQVVTRGSGVAIVGTSPSSTVYEPLWWDSNSGQLFVQYDDGTSVQWVSANSIDASTLEGSFLPLTGGTVTGPVVFPGIKRGYGGLTVDITALSPAGAAIGDGVTDASPAFAAAAALPGGTTLILPAGKYLLKTTKHFYFAHRVNMVGAGRDCVTISYPASTTITEVPFWFGAGGRVSGITVDLANIIQPSTGPIGIFYAFSQRLDFVDNAVINGSPTAYIYFLMLVQETGGYSIVNNIFSMTAPTVLPGNGIIAVQSTTGAVSTNGKITGNILTNGDLALETTNTTISGNTFNNWGLWGAAIYINGTYATSNNVVANNTLIGRTAALGAEDVLAGMEIGSSNTVITGNVLLRCPGDGIEYFGPDTTVVGNTIIGAGRTGLGQGAAGIVARATSTSRPTGGIVEGNTVRDDGSGTLTYGFADEPYNAGAGTGVNTTTQTCTTHIGDNNFSGTLGPVCVRSNETYPTTDSGMFLQGGGTTGTANAMVLAATTPPIIGTTLVRGLVVSFIPSATNTGAATLSIKTAIANALADFLNVPTKTTGAMAINKLLNGALVPLTGGELTANIPTTVTYVGSNIWVWGANALSGSFLPTAGGTLTGQLTVPNNMTVTAAAGVNPAVTLTRAASGAYAQIISYMGANPRWAILPGNSTAESGAATGSDFQILCFDNAGGYLGSPINIARATSIVSFSQPIVNGSDRRMKSDIEPVTNALAIVEQLQGVFYKHRDSARRQVGLIAQDVVGPLPEVVFDGIPDGEKADGDPMMGVAYPNIVAVLVEAIKELNAKLDGKPTAAGE